MTMQNNQHPRGRLFHFPESDLQQFFRRIPEGEALFKRATHDDIASAKAETFSWIVHLSGVPTFRQLARGAPLPAVLWCPRPEPDSPESTVPEDWWEDFHAVVRAGSEVEEAQLAHFGRCPRYFEVLEAVTEVSTDWFQELPGSPWTLPSAELPSPIGTDYFPLLCDNDELRRVVYEELQSRAEAIWGACFPGVDAIGDWLDGEDRKPAFAAILARSPLLRREVVSQGRRWGEAGLITEEQLAAKLSSVGLETRASSRCRVELGRRLSEFSAAPGRWLGELAAGIADGLQWIDHRFASRCSVLPGTVRSDKTPVLPPLCSAGEELRDQGRITIHLADAPWTLGLAVSDESLEMRIGYVAAPSGPPIVRFYRGAELVQEVVGDLIDDFGKPYGKLALEDSLLDVVSECDRIELIADSPRQ